MRTRRTSHRIVAATAAVLLLVACGSDDEPDEAATSPEETATGAEPTEADTPTGGTATTDDGTDDEPGPLDGTAAEEPAGGDGSFADGPNAQGTGAAQDPAPEGVDAVEAAADPSIGLASAGLIVLDGERLVDGLGFASPEDEVVDVLEVITGARPDADTLPDECAIPGGTTRRYDDLGLTVTFADGTIVGWYANDDGSPRTINEVGIGSTLGEFREAIPSTELVEGGTSLGNEFTSDAGYRGLVSSAGGDGLVEALWAGGICTIR